MAYFSLSNLAQVITRTAANVADDNSGPYFPTVLCDLNSRAVIVTAPGGAQYFLAATTTDHGSNADDDTGISFHLCPVASNPAGANWVPIDDVAAYSKTNPVFGNDSTPGNQPETACLRYIDGIIYIFWHEEIGGVQRTAYGTVDATTLDITRVGFLFPSAEADEMPTDHDGYARIGGNYIDGQPLFRGIRGRLFAHSLFAWGTGAGESGRFFNHAIWRANSVDAFARERLQCIGQQEATWDGIDPTLRRSAIESAATGFRRAADGKIVGLATMVTPASGSAARESDMIEMVFDHNYRPASQPRTILAHGGHADYSDEVGQCEPINFGDTWGWVVFFQATDTDNVNSIYAANLAFDPEAEAPESWPIRNDEYETDFRLLSELPAAMTKHANTTASFSSSTGLTLTAPAGSNTKGFCRLGSSFVPSYYDVIDMIFDGLTTSDGNLTVTFGFAVDSGASMDEQGDASEHYSVFCVAGGAAKTSEKTAAGSTTNITGPDTSNEHAFGRTVATGSSLPKQLGLRWWPHRQQIAFIGEDGVTGFRHNVTRVATLSTARVPTISILSVNGGSTVTFRKVTIHKGSIDAYRAPLVTAPALASTFGLQPIGAGV